MSALLVTHLALASVGAALVAAAALGARLAMQDVIGRYTVLRICLAVLLLLAPLQIVASRIAPPDVLRAATARPADAVARWSCQVAGTSADQSGASTTPTGDEGASTARVAEAPKSEVRFSGTMAILSVYLLGVLAVSCYMVARLLRTAILLRRCRTVTDETLLAVFDRLRIEARIRQSIPLLESDDVTSPSCWGLFVPVVIVPTAAQRTVPAGQLHCALRHELAHIRRHDAWSMAAQMVATCVFWFHPLVILFARAVRQDCELSCDAAVVRTTGCARTYAQALLSYVRPDPPQPGCRRPRAMLAGFGTYRSLKRRLSMIERIQFHRSSPPSRWPVVASAAAALLALGVHGALAMAVTPADEDGKSTEAVHQLVDAAAMQSAGQYQRALELYALAADRQASVPAALRAMQATIPMPQAEGPSWITMQETIVSATNATIEGNTIEAQKFLLNLPEGSDLRAIIEGDRVTRRNVEGGVEVVVENGIVKLVDTQGVVRSVARPVTATGDPATLQLRVTIESDEVVLQTTAERAGEPLPVRVELDLTTGIPPREEQPPHGAVRYWLRLPESGEDGVRLKMQWIYDVTQIPPSQDGC